MKLLTNKIKIIITAVVAVLLLAIGLYGGIQIGKYTKDTQPQAVSLSFRDIGELATTSAYVTAYDAFTRPEQDKLNYTGVYGRSILH